jgi:hypothetical protein
MSFEGEEKMKSHLGTNPQENVSIILHEESEQKISLIHNGNAIKRLFLSSFIAFSLLSPSLLFLYIQQKFFLLSFRKLLLVSVNTLKGRINITA